MDFKHPGNNVPGAIQGAGHTAVNESLFQFSSILQSSESYPRLLIQISQQIRQTLISVASDLLSGEAVKYSMRS